MQRVLSKACRSLQGRRVEAFERPARGVREARLGDVRRALQWLAGRRVGTRAGGGRGVAPQPSPRRAIQRRRTEAPPPLALAHRQDLRALRRGSGVRRRVAAPCIPGTDLLADVAAEDVVADLSLPLV